MTINKIITILLKVALFIFIFIIVWNIVFSILWLDKSSIYDFYQEKRNSVDVVYVGSSSVYSSFNTLQAYKEYGLTTGVLASDVQPLGATKFMLEEARKYQNPSIYILDINLYGQNVDEIAYINIRKATDALKNSSTRKDCIDYLLKYTTISKDEYINYYLSFLTYHNSWKDIDINNFKSRMIKGHYLSELTISISPQEHKEWNNEYIEIPQENIEMINDLIAYIKEKKLNVLFVSAPKILNNEEAGKLNTIISLLEDNGFNVINTNNDNFLNLDYQNDFYNSSHVNAYGARKFTNFLCKYLYENYNIGANNKYDKSWEKAYDIYINLIS